MPLLLNAVLLAPMANNKFLVCYPEIREYVMS